MNTVHIDSKYTLGAFVPAADEVTIKQEPMLHRATREVAYLKGGVLTRSFLDVLPWEDILVDSRVHMLMPGMFPCIPGWHHDDVPREREDRQPNYINPSYKAEHCMALWGDCCRTEFAVGSRTMEIPPVGSKIYKTWHPQVDALCGSGELQRESAPVNQLVYFDWQTWHRGTDATKKGFRFFIRATRNTGLEARNEIRFNANVYMPVIEEGW
jgi:hypothetical protein